MQILTFSSLYPNAIKPRHGIFVENRLRQLVRDFPVTSRVVAPIPYFPLQFLGYSQYRELSGVKSRDFRNGFQIAHPRFLVVPGVSWRIAPRLMYAATLRCVAQLHRECPIDLIDSHFVYPDGVAATMIGRKLGIPVSITARGTDINYMPRFKIPKAYIQWTLDQCSVAISVCQALKDEMIQLGARDEKVHVLRNGVDLQLFHPMDRDMVRKELNISSTTLLSVGYLIERKGHHIAIEALRELPGINLIIVGDGPDLQKLKNLASKLGVDARVRFMGAVPQNELTKYYSACDLLILASSREGWANVLLESMACGTRVVATNIWGTPEVVGAPNAGILMQDRSSRELSNCVTKILATKPDRLATRGYAENFNWANTSRGQFDIFSNVISKRQFKE